MTQGPAMSTSAGSPRTTPSAIRTERTGTGRIYRGFGFAGQAVAPELVAPPVSDRRDVRRNASHRLQSLVGRFDETREQRMRAQRLRLEFWMELHGQVPRMARQFHDLDELAIERSADDPQSGVRQRLFVQAVEL